MNDDDAQIESFWQRARHHTRLNLIPAYTGPNALDSLRPPAWAFGATPDEADRLLRQVLEGTTTATAAPLRDYEIRDENLPAVAALGIVLDGSGRPRALVVTTEVAISDRGDVEREAHGAVLSSRVGDGDAADQPVVIERFRLLYSE